MAAAAGPRILFGIVTDNSESALRLVEDNMAAVSGWPERVIVPSWAVIVYNNRTPNWDRLPAQAARLGAVLRMLEDARGPRTRAKLVYQLRFADLLSLGNATLDAAAAQSARSAGGWRSMKYAHWTPLHLHEAAPDYMWLLDGDISLQRFRLDAFIARWQCSFNGGPPLVAQPPVLQDTQAFWHVNWGSWAANASRPGAVDASFVEIQAPLVDGGYFRHLAQGDAAVIADKGRELDSDWGIDMMWCSAARQFDPTRRACAVVLYPVSHLDSRTLDKDAGYSVVGQQLMKWMHKRWYSLVHFPYGLSAQPLMRIPANKYRRMRQATLLQMLAPKGDRARRRACHASNQLVLTAPSALSGLHVFWINGDADRRRRMEDELSELGIVNHTRVPAVMRADILRLQAQGFQLKGLRLEEQVQSSVRDARGATAQQKVTYSYSELGCTLSHLRAARMAFESGAEASLVLEDDLVLRHIPSWTHSLSELMARAPPGWRILQLHTINAPLLRAWCSYAVGFRRWEKLHWSSAAYLLSRRAAAALSDASGPVDAPDYATRLAGFIARHVAWHASGHAADHASPLVADNLIFRTNLPHAYTFSRPLFALAPSRSSIQTAEVHRVLDTPMRALVDAYFAPDKQMERCASLSFSGSLAKGVVEGASARRGVRRQAEDTGRVGCSICGDGGVLHPSLIVAGACVGSTEVPPFHPLPLPNVSFPPHRGRVHMHMHVCRKRLQHTRPVMCTEVEQYFTSARTPGGDLRSFTSCRHRFGHLGCCDLAPKVALPAHARPR